MSPILGATRLMRKKTQNVLQVLYPYQTELRFYTAAGFSGKQLYQAYKLYGCLPPKTTATAFCRALRSLTED